jgi:DNA-binding HxlR family transcriptional regulator
MRFLVSQGASMANADCRINGIARILGRKWTLELIYHLQGRWRFCELQKAVGGVNPATLSERLKSLEQEGLVRRCEISDGPRHVEYELTEKGHDLTPVLNAMLAWVERWQLEEETRPILTAGER